MRWKIHETLYEFMHRDNWDIIDFGLGRPDELLMCTFSGYTARKAFIGLLALEGHL